jgi:hypothetical protein
MFESETCSEPGGVFEIVQRSHALDQVRAKESRGSEDHEFSLIFCVAGEDGGTFTGLGDSVHHAIGLHEIPDPLRNLVDSLIDSLPQPCGTCGKLPRKGC